MLVDYFHVQLRQSLEVLLPLSATVEVLSVPRREIYPIPGVDPALLGVVNHYGQLLWVLDLGDLLDLPNLISKHGSETYTLIVLRTRAETQSSGSSVRQVSCVVSTLQEIVSLDTDEFESVLIPALKTAQTYIADTTMLHGQPIAILDVDSIFARLQIPDAVAA